MSTTFVSVAVMSMAAWRRRGDFCPKSDRLPIIFTKRTYAQS
jgi:hypothetical protein